MQRSVFHTVVAVLAAAVLMLQHAPIVPTGHGSHDHCIHCTANYCTMGGCNCGHKHKSNPHKGHVPGRAAHPGIAEHHGRARPGTAVHNRDVDTRAAEHYGAAHAGSAAHHGGAPAVAEMHSHSNGAPNSTVGTTIEPCNTPPSGIITFNLDKFVGGTSAAASELTLERPSSARYAGLADQLVIDQIFRPPVQG